MENLRTLTKSQMHPGCVPPRFHTLVQSLSRGIKWPSLSFDLPTLQAHRGRWIQGARENSLDSVLLAAANGTSMVELDLRLTKDNVVVLCHDRNLQRVFSSPADVHQISAREFCEIYGGTSLEQVLLHPQGPRFFNLELKNTDLVRDCIERRTVDLLSRCQQQHRVMFSSFSPLSLWKLTHLAPYIPRALLASTVDDQENLWILREMLFTPALKLHALHLDHKMLSKMTDVQAWTQRGFKVNVFTVNSAPRAHELLNWGCSSIISDHILPDDLLNPDS